MRNTKLRFGAIMLVLIMCFSLFVSCEKYELKVEDVQKDPYGAIMDGTEDYFNSLCDRYDDSFAVFETLSESIGTYSIGLNVPDMGNVTLNAVVDPSAGAYSAKGQLSAEGMNLDASLWGDKSNIALSIPYVLGEKNYGVKLDTLEDDLANSELLESLTGMTYDDLMQTLEDEMGFKLDDIKDIISIDKWKAAFEKLMADEKELFKNKEYTVLEETYKIGETDVPVISVEYTVTADDAKKSSELTLDMMESMFGKIFEIAGVSFEDVRAEMMAAETEFNDVKCKAYLGKDTGEIVAADVDSPDLMKGTVVYGEDVSKKFEMSFNIDYTMDVDADEKLNLIGTVKEITEAGKSGFDIDATVKVGGEEHTVAIDIVRNDADGKYEIKMVADGEELGSVAGVLTYSDEEFKLTVDSITAEGETTEIGLTVSAKVGGTVEAVPAYTNVITAPVEELEDLLGIIESLMYTPDYDDYYDDYYGDEYYGDEYYDGEYTGDLTIDQMMEGMTQEEIDQFYKDLEDLGMTTDDILNMLDGSEN